MRCSFFLLLFLLSSCGAGNITPVNPAPKPVPGFQVALEFSPSVAPQFRAAFESAALRWQSVISDDLPDVNGSVPLGDCLPRFLEASAVDDVVILIDTFNEGPGGLLGQAGPCFTRKSNNLTIVGVMLFDASDLTELSKRGQLESTIVHEMGHVLGIGTLWERKGLVKLANPSRPISECDTNPQYVGAKGKLEWEKLGRSGDVPLEKGYGTGTCEGHWDENILTNELMTGFLNAGANPLSRLSIASLEDLGYTVNYAPADVYALLTAPIRLEQLGQNDHSQTERLHSEPFTPIGSF